MAMDLLRLIGVFLASFSGVAEAGPFEPKSSQGDLNSAPIQRPFVLPKGWLELGLATDTKRSTHYRGSDGGLRAQEPGVAWRYSRVWFEVRQGFSKRVTLYGRVPMVIASLELAGGNDINTVHVGDSHLGVVTQPWLTGPHSLAFSADLKLPTGVEWPSDVGGPGNTRSFLTGTGVTNLGLFTHGALVFLERIRLGADLGYIRKFPAVVGYVEQVDGFGNGVLNPGDEWVVNGRLMGAIVPKVTLGVEARYRWMGEAEMGVTGSGSDTMSPLRHTAGSWLDGRLILGVEPVDHWELQAWVSSDLSGADTRTFAHLGLEEFSPQPGLTIGGRVVCRW
jgi:hypothetical protein